MSIDPNENHLYDHLPVAIVCSDISGHVTYFNPAAISLFGSGPESDNWLSRWKIYDTNGQPLAPENTLMLQIGNKKQPQKEELIVEYPTGQYRNILAHSSPLFDLNYTYTGTVHTLVDITDQKSDEIKQATLAAIIESSEDAIISKSLNGVITSWNKAAERMFGYLEAEAIGKHITMLIPNERLSEENLIIGKVIKGEVVDHFETFRRTKTGVELAISLTVSPIKNRLGIITGASKIARDITRQKEAEIKLQQYVENLEVLNSVGKALAEDLDVQGILQKVTDATTQLTGAAFGAFFYNVVDNKGESYMLYTLSGVPRAAFEKFDMPRNTAVFKPTFDGEGIVRVDDITKDPRYGHNHPHYGMPKGHLPVVSYLAVPVIAKNGQVIGGLFFGHPEPGRFTKEHENQVDGIASHAAIALDNAKLYEEIQQLNKKKDEFIGLASHELKTPITSISGYLQIVEKDPSNWERNAVFIRKARAQVGKLSGLISDLLDVSKIETGKLPLKFSSFDLVDLIKDVVELTSYSNDSHPIETNYQLNELTVYADRLRIEQVIVNLLTNAFRYSPKANRIIVSMSTANNKVKVSIQDFGIGIEPAHLQNIFTRFYRVDDLAAHMSGLGIGLYISHEIIARHKGTLNVESEHGKGSTFSFEIPLIGEKENT